MARGYLTIDDFRNFIKKANLYPIEKDLALVYERFDKDEDRAVPYEEFVRAVTPFMNNEMAWNSMWKFKFEDNGYTWFQLNLNL